MTRALVLLTVIVVTACVPTVEPSPAPPIIVVASPTRSPSPLAPTPTPVVTSPVNPTANPFPSVPFFPVPSALAADPAAGTIVFSDRAGSWRYDGPRGALAVQFAAASLQALDRHVVATQPLIAGFDAAAFDARTSAFLRTLPQETPKPDSLSVSADGRRVAYVTPQKGLRIAFQQQLGNVDGRALARDRLFNNTLIAPSGSVIAATGPSLADVSPPGSQPFDRGAGIPRDVWLVDVESGASRQIYCTFGVIDGLVYFVLDGHLATFDPDTNAIRRLVSDAAWAEDGVRVSDDGKDLLVLRRRVADGQLELWLMSRDASKARALVRFSPPLSPGDASQYGTYPSAYTFDRLAWSR